MLNGESFRITLHMSLDEIVTLELLVNRRRLGENVARRRERLVLRAIARLACQAHETEGRLALVQERAARAERGAFMAVRMYARPRLEHGEGCEQNMQPEGMSVVSLDATSLKRSVACARLLPPLSLKRLISSGVWPNWQLMPFLQNSL